MAGRAARIRCPDLSGVDYVYLRAGGIHVNIRPEEHKLCLLVMIGVRADGRKELIALADAYRESAESWADLLRDCEPPRHARPGAGSRGRGAGVLGRAARGVSRGTTEKRCWFHKIANVLAALRALLPPGGSPAPKHAPARTHPQIRPGRPPVDLVTGVSTDPEY